LRSGLELGLGLDNYGDNNIKEVDETTAIAAAVKINVDFSVRKRVFTFIDMSGT
jgi:hypothetical protein